MRKGNLRPHRVQPRFSRCFFSCVRPGASLEYPPTPALDNQIAMTVDNKKFSPPPGWTGWIALVLAWFTCLGSPSRNPAQGSLIEPAGSRQRFNFNFDWRFVKADITNAVAPAFDDSSWEVVSAPHCFNETDTFDDW